MLIPTKHQDLKSNTLVIGADILFYLKNDELNLEELFKKVRVEKNIDLDIFFDAITFLWLIDAVIFSDNNLSKKNKKDDIKEDLF